MKNISILIPNLNQDEALLSSLNHLGNQDVLRRGFPVIVSNNGNSGQLDSLIPAYSQISAEVLQQNETLDATEHFQQMAKVVETKWIIFVGCGDALSLDALEAFLSSESSDSTSRITGGKLRVSGFSDSAPNLTDGGGRVRAIHRDFFSLRVPYQEALVGNVLSAENFVASCEKTSGPSRQDWPHIVTQLKGASIGSGWIEILDPSAFVFQHKEGWYNKKYEGIKKLYSHLLAIVKYWPRPSVFMRIFELLFFALPKSLAGDTLGE